MTRVHFRIELCSLELCALLMMIQRCNTSPMGGRWNLLSDLALEQFREQQSPSKEWQWKRSSDLTKDWQRTNLQLCQCSADEFCLVWRNFCKTKGPGYYYYLGTSQQSSSSNTTSLKSGPCERNMWSRSIQVEKFPVSRRLLETWWILQNV